jgi:lipopolysaccharide biosynthesis regulator YciM
LLLATTAIYANDFKKAETVLAKGISDNPKSVKLLALQTSILMNSRRFLDAEAALKQIIQIEPEKISHILRLTEFYWQTNHLKKTTEQINTMISKNLFNVNIRLQIAQFYQKKSDYQTAASILK